MLSGPHLSQLRNPLIADAFHRTGAVEIWGRGTNRVISECKRYGLEPPSFEELGNALVVTIRAPIGPEAEGNARSRPDQGQLDGRMEPGRLGQRAVKILSLLRSSGPMPAAAILEQLDEPITQRALLMDLRRLRQAGYIGVRGRSRATTYYLRTDES